MKATHPDGRTFDGDVNEFHRTYGPAGFVLDDDAPTTAGPGMDDEQAPAGDAKSAADPAQAEPKQSKPAAKKANGK